MLLRFAITTIGTGAAVPARGRSPSALALEVNGEFYLVDCGEGTQERLRMAGINFMRIGSIFISHLHGDHFLGVVGLLSTMHLLGRRRPLSLYAPSAMREIVAVQFRASRTYLRFPLHHHDLPPPPGEVVMEDERLQVIALPMRHGLPATGFLFRERPAPRNLRPDMIASIPVPQRDAVKHGADLTLDDGSTIANAALTLPPHEPRAFAYCSDTAYEPALVPLIAGADLLYHEATFTEDLRDRAKETLHSTAREAALIARDAGVRRLLLGHFSSRYKDPDRLLHEARQVFPAAEVCQEGATYVVDQRSAV